MMSQKELAGSGSREIYLDRVFGGAALIALHEAGSLQGHLEGVNERLRVAARARNVGELIRDQIDLIPETRNRFLRDHEVRRQLWRGFVRDLTAPVQRAA